MEQQTVVDRGVVDPGLPANTDLTGTAAAPTSTVVSEGEWLAVSTEGFSEQQRGRPLAHLAKELVQNALDSLGGAGQIDLAVRPMGPRTAWVRCADDGPGAADLSQLNIVFVTGKKDGVTQRGRMSRGFKELLSIATGATVRSRDQELLFTLDEDGTRRVVHRRSLDWHHGFEAVMQVEHDETKTDLAAYFQSFLVPGEVTLRVNGAPVPPRPVHRVVTARLTTERFAKGRWEKPALATRVHLVAVGENETPLIYEMGIPVCEAEWSERYHCDVQQRCPMNPNRDAVISGYPARLHRSCLAALLPEMTTGRTLAFWVGEAAQDASDEVQKAVVAKAFGDNVVRAVPATGRFDHNADAEELGSTVVHSAHMSDGFRKLLLRQVPTAAALAKREMKRQAEAATKAGLSRADIAVLDLSALSEGGPEAARAIARHGRDTVLARMDFAGWFAGAVVACRHGCPREGPIQAAYLTGRAATWSFSGTLTLSLAYEAFWQGQFGPANYELLLHELAHHEAFHHGRGFPKEVEAYAGAAVQVMLARAGEAWRLFSWLLASPCNAESVTGEERLRDSLGADRTDKPSASQPSWMQQLRSVMQGLR